MKPEKITGVRFEERPRIGNRSDVLDLLDEMINRIEKSNGGALPGFRGMNKAIGSEGYYWPRLAIIRDAVERGII